MQARIYFGSTKVAADYPPAFGGLQKGADDTSGGHFSKSNKAELCNGSTYDSDSYCLGSNPSSAATREKVLFVKGFFFLLWEKEPFKKSSNRMLCLGNCIMQSRPKFL